MALTSGSRIGSYEITGLLGVGGMGEVYRARDTKLNREVALKVLPDAFAQDAERMARLEREAQLLASLNHPGIAGIYGLEEGGAAASHFKTLIMELAEGPTLAERIAKGAIPVDEALQIARQIAEALEYAHERGIIHRDLKPANVKITTDGQVKLLDFGLAKAIETERTGASGSRAGQAQSPTITVMGTQDGVILGTAAYMSPEQARGKLLDKRSDIWSFGCVLYEMLAGRPAFTGDTITDVLASVLTKDPDWTSLPPGSPTALLHRCLAKDPKRRLRDMGDAFGECEPAAQPPAPAQSPWRQPLVWALTLVAAASAAAALTLILWTPPQSPSTAVAHLSIVLPADLELTSAPAVSRDGRTVAYAAKRAAGQSQLYLRNLDSFEARPVTGSSGAMQPFFSPDGRWVAFFARAQLLKAAVAGGSPTKVTDVPQAYGGTWNEDDTIIFTTALGSGLLRVPAGGGTPESLTRPDGADAGLAHTWPQALPGGRRILFTVHGKRVNGTAMLSLETRRWEIVMPGWVGAVFGPSGHLLATDLNAELKAARFDPTRPERATADATLLAEVFYEDYSQRPWLAVSKEGTLVYAPGNPARRSLVWAGRSGKAEPAIPDQDRYLELTLSPDGSKAAVKRDSDLWIYDFQRGTQRRLTFQGNVNAIATSPVWTRDGARLVFSSDSGGEFDIYSVPVDGSRPPERLLQRPYDQFPTSMRADGTLTFAESHPTTGEDLWILTPDGKAAPLQVTRFYESNSRFSPDGRRIAYDSDESGRGEIYVEQYPSKGGRLQVSSGGGELPVWSRDGTELFYCSPNAVMVAAVQADGSFAPGRPLFDRSPFHFLFHTYDASPDGKRFLMIRRDPGSVPRQLNVILSWHEELKHLLK